ncbi:MAG: RNA polymerase subunit sigma [Bacteroidetes bacterium 47-18]|nr:MAG: RNA polymerase subunit sigma [Bacteroidetes bacterium 47-18]
MSSVSFNSLIESNSTYLQPFAISLTQDADDAKDLVQETLYKAIVYKDKFQEGTNVKAWLYTIMRNIFINNYRRLQKFRGVSSDTPQDFYLVKQQKFATNGGVSNINLAAIKKAIDDLPEILRISFELHYLGYKYQEIAETLNEPLGTIKSRIHFARKTLTENLKHLR